MKTFKVDDHVEAGGPGTEDWDHGYVVEVDDDQATVAWVGSGDKTPCPLSLLRAYGGEERFAPDEDSDAYRACYWLSDDRQAEVVLTLPDHAGLSDEDLYRLAREEAERGDLDLTTGTLEIGEWVGA